VVGEDGVGGRFVGVAHSESVRFGRVLVEEGDGPQLVVGVARGPPETATLSPRLPRLLVAAALVQIKLRTLSTTSLHSYNQGLMRISIRLLYRIQLCRKEGRKKLS
jgi:hypothetical protein